MISITKLRLWHFIAFTVVAQLCLLGWLFTRRTAIDIDPRAYPYRFLKKESGQLPIQIITGRFMPNSSKIMVWLYENVGELEYHAKNSAFEAVAWGRLGSESQIGPTYSLDADNDGLDEIFFTRHYPRYSSGSDMSAVDSIVFYYQGMDSKRVRFDLLTMDLLTDNSTYSIEESSWPGCSIQPLYTVSPDSSHVRNRYCALGIWGVGKINERFRFIHLYRTGNPPKLVKRVRTAFYASYGVWHYLPDSSQVLTCCGSPPNNGVMVPISYFSQDGATVHDTLDDSLGAWIQLSSEGDIRWVLQIDKSGGGTMIYDCGNLNMPLQGVFLCDAYHNGDAIETILLQIDRSTGAIIDSTHITGRWIPFVGNAVKECGYIGLIRTSPFTSQLIRADGSVCKELAIRQENVTNECHLLHLPNNRIGFLTHYDANYILLYDLQGHLLAVNNGLDICRTISFNDSKDSIDFALLKDDNRYYFSEVVPGSYFWWFWRWRWVILALSFPPLIMAGLYGLTGWAVERIKSHRKLEEAFNELEIRVIERTEDLTIANRNIEEEIILREHAEQEANRNREHFETIFNSIEDGIITIDKSMCINSANGAFGQILQVDSEQIAGIPLDRVIPGEMDAIVKMIKNNRMTVVRDYHIEIMTVNGEKRILRLTAMPFSEDRTNLITLLIVRDVTKLYQLERQVTDRTKFGNIIGGSPKMQELYDNLGAISQTMANVLITGESGTGKELVAEAIHYKSARASGPFLAKSCVTLSEQLLESELFGHIKGAFTSAIEDRVGLFEAAQGGTLFLDEIGDISPILQVKLLRVLQEREYSRVGETEVRKTNARIIAATNRNLQDKLRDGSFREDLFYRLNVFSIHLPPLRERISDIKLLVDNFIQRFNEQMDKHVQSISDEAMEILIKYHWPGNVRELIHFIEWAMMLCQDDTLYPKHFPPELIKQISSDSIPEIKPDDGSRKSFRNIQHRLDADIILSALESNYWNVTRTARQLGIVRSYLYRKMKEFDIRRP